MQSCVVPTRHGTHLPHDSSRQKSMKYLATLTMQLVSSMTIIPPEPMNEPTPDERLVVDRHVQELRRGCSRRKGRRSVLP